MYAKDTILTFFANYIEKGWQVNYNIRLTSWHRWDLIPEAIDDANMIPTFLGRTFAKSSFPCELWSWRLSPNVRTNNKHTREATTFYQLR